MRLNTIITLGASAAFGIIAVFLARSWINGAVENEFRDTSDDSVVTSAPALQTRPVLVASIDLQFGDILSADTLKTVEYPLDYIPFGSFETSDDIFIHDVEQNVIALTSIAKHEVILPRKISGPNGKAALSARIRQGFRAASIRVDSVTGVSGFVLPGDLVDVLYTAQPDPEADTNNYLSDILLQSVKVLAIDQTQDETANTAKLAKTVTLEVAHAEAQSLALAVQTGHLSLTLRSSGETSTTPSQQLSTAQLSKVRTRSRARAPQIKRPLSIKPKTQNIASITIIRGDETESVSVLRESDTLLKRSGQADTNLAGG